MKFSSTCSCGDVMTVDAGSKEEAVTKLQAMMTEDAIAKHMAEKHPGDPVPSMEQAHALIAANTVAVA